MTMRFPPKSSFLCPFRSFVPFRAHALPLPSLWPGGMGALPPMFDESCEARL